MARLGPGFFSFLSLSVEAGVRWMRVSCQDEKVTETGGGAFIYTCVRVGNVLQQQVRSLAGGPDIMSEYPVMKTSL
jgi:hypothetical protein